MADSPINYDHQDVPGIWLPVADPIGINLQIPYVTTVLDIADALQSDQGEGSWEDAFADFLYGLGASLIGQAPGWAFEAFPGPGSTIGAVYQVAIGVLGVPEDNGDVLPLGDAIGDHVLTSLGAQSRLPAYASPFGGKGGQPGTLDSLQSIAQSLASAISGFHAGAAGAVQSSGAMSGLVDLKLATSAA